MKTSWRTELPQLVVILAMFAAAAYFWSVTPERIPVHWGVDGRPNGYGGRFTGLLLLPLTAIGIYAVMLLAPKIDPRRSSYEAFAGPYAVVRLAVLVFLGVLYGAMIVSILGGQVNITSLVLILMGGLFTVLGGVIGKLRPNWFVGIRTPWTLSSEETWTRTHRVGGQVFLADGILFLLAGLIGRPWAFWAAMAVVIAGAIGLTVFSYFVWRGASDHLPAAR